MSDFEVSLSTAEQLGLLPEEFDKIKEILGRTPNFTELSVFSVMWSEHCSYKNSIQLLKTLPSEGEKVLVGVGEEGAGMMDLGNEYAVIFKMESHNHPSAIEPYQGAATGVGGIHRDIFSMGARPIASLNSLRFGEIELPKTQHLMKGVVKGIGDYGNAFGVPTVAGDVYFDACYNTNPLVNAMSVGIVKKGESATGTASGIGNPIFIVGSATGKDGIHGASFASEIISKDSEDKLPSVQVGDPFTEKLLLEATLEAIQSGGIVGIQDMGAAGITCATSEMSAKGEVGMDVFLDKVPTRQEDMTPVEILLSESQERMLFVIEKGKEQTILDIFDKWDLNCAQIGEVTDTGNLRYFMNEELVGEIPAQVLVLGGGAPVYVREQREPAYFAERNAFDPNSVPEPIEHDLVIRHLLSQVSIASKKWVTEQYDSMVGAANMSTNLPSDAAIVRMRGMKTGIVLSSDCNSRYVYADPEKGAMLAVSEAARNIACAGGTPLGVSNCLNFGNPYDPEVYFQFAQAIKGMGAACRQFETPITGGNVSFYNQSETGPIYPTPMIGMLGVVENANENQMSMDFKAKGHQLYLIGKVVEDFGCSEYIYSYHKRALSPAPYVNLAEEKLLQKTLLELIENKAISSAHDISDGGLLISLLESAFIRDLGFMLRCPDTLRKDAFLYGESGGRAVVSVATKQLGHFARIVKSTGIDMLHLGTVSGEHVQIDGERLGEVGEYRNIYEGALRKKMQG